MAAPSTSPARSKTTPTWCLVAAGLGNAHLTDVIKAREDESFLDVYQRMIKANIRAIPIVDEHDCVVGLASVQELLHLLLHSLDSKAHARRVRTSLENIARILEGQIDHGVDLEIEQEFILTVSASSADTVDARLHEFPPDRLAVIAYRGGGGTKIPYAGAQLPWAYLNTLANGLQMAGPTLDALTYERALLSGAADYGGDSNRFQYWLHFGPGDYSGISDAREVYWDANEISRIDGKAGAYVSMNSGRRFKPGQFPRTAFTIPGR